MHISGSARSRHWWPGGLEEIQVLHAERTGLRALVLDLLKAFDAPEQEQAAVKRRARDELAAR